MNTKKINMTLLAASLVAMTMAPLVQAEETNNNESTVGLCDPGPVMEFVNCTRAEVEEFIAKLISSGADEAIYIACAEYELIFGEEPHICYCWRLTGSPICHADIRNQ